MENYKNKEYFFQLDGIRALAIVLVIIWHYGSCITSGNFLGGAGYYFNILTSWTWTGVDLFFVLSGFLIGYILLSNRGSVHYFKTFFMRRILRIFPAYYLLLFSFLMYTTFNSYPETHWLTEDPHPFISYVFFVQNFFMMDRGLGGQWLNVTWSISVEEQFYVVLPFLLRYLSEKYILRFVLTCILIAPFFRHVFPGWGPFVLLPARMDALFLGVLIAYGYYKGFTYQKINKYLLIIIPLLFLLIFLGHTYSYIGRFGDVYSHSIWSLFYGLLIIAALGIPKNSRLFSFLTMKPLLFIAKISYGLYLYHELISGFMHQLILKQRPQINNLTDLGITILSLAVAILISYLSLILFESYLQKQGKKITY